MTRRSTKFVRSCNWVNIWLSSSGSSWLLATYFYFRRKTWPVSVCPWDLANVYWPTYVTWKYDVLNWSRLVGCLYKLRHFRISFDPNGFDSFRHIFLPRLDLLILYWLNSVFSFCHCIRNHCRIKMEISPLMIRPSVTQSVWPVPDSLVFPIHCSIFIQLPSMPLALQRVNDFACLHICRPSISYCSFSSCR